MGKLVYGKFAEKLGKDTLGFDISDTPNIAVACVNATGLGTLYTVNQDVDEFFSDIPAAAVIADSKEAANGGPTYLASKSFANGRFTSDPIDLTGVTGDEFEAVVIYRDTGNPATSDLIAYIDSGTGLPFTPAGGKVTITPDPTNGYFDISPAPV